MAPLFHGFSSSVLGWSPGPAGRVPRSPNLFEVGGNGGHLSFKFVLLRGLRFFFEPLPVPFCPSLLRRYIEGFPLMVGPPLFGPPHIFLVLPHPTVFSSTQAPEALLCPLCCFFSPVPRDFEGSILVSPAFLTSLLRSTRATSPVL